MIYKNRIIKLFNNIDTNLDAIIIKNYLEPFIDNNFFYFTGLEEGIYEGCTAILFPEKKSELLISDLEYESTKKSKDIIHKFNNKNVYEKLLMEILSSSKTIGLNYDIFNLNDYINLKKLFPNIKFFNVSKDISKLRLIKDHHEIERLKKSCNIADKTMGKIPDIIYDGISEDQLAAEIDYYLGKNGANKSAFNTISSFGKNTSKPHYSHGNITIKKGDLIICDFGANYGKYNSDITRTFVFGKSNKKQKKMHETVLNAQSIALKEIKKGAQANEIHNKVFSYIEKSEFKSYFIHSTGHSIGLNVHDVGGSISSDCKILLNENMTFTIEPGIYIPKIGGVRIEDDILVTKNSYKLLTNSSRDLIEI